MFKKVFIKTILALIFFVSLFGNNVSYADGSTVYLNGIVEKPYKLPINVEIYNHDTGELVNTYIITEEEGWVKEIYLNEGKYDFNAFLSIDEGVQRAEKLKFYDYTRDVTGDTFTVDFMEGSNLFIRKYESKLLGIETPSGSPYFTGATSLSEGKKIANDLAMSQTGDSPENEGYVAPEIDAKYDNYEQRKDNIYNGEFFESPTGEGKNFYEKDLEDGDINNLSDDIKNSGESIRSENEGVVETDDTEEGTKKENINQKKSEKIDSNEDSKNDNKRLVFVVLGILIIGLIVYILKRKRLF